MARDRNIKFRTRKQTKREQLKKFSAVLAAFVVVCLLFSFLYIYTRFDGDFSSVFSGTSQTTEVKTTNIDKAEPKSVSLLLFCSNTDKSELRFLCVAKFSYPSCEVTLQSVLPDERITFDGKIESFSSVYKKYGADSLKAAVSEYTGAAVDRYIGSADGSFKETAKLLGGFTVDIPEPITFRGEFTLILSRGSQQISGDALIKYMRYLIIENENGLFEQSEIMSQIISSVVKPEKAQKAKSIYTTLANNLETDITIVDFSEHGDMVDRFFTGEKMTFIINNTAGGEAEE